ncbi:transporter substrate-binding domain-containing protein [Fluviispira multicolorata]|uniref:transporter substrate-binding domain-containing protein n=1 Tax=Fluviispira multicolorata TaxID=2654512 RepID=UPI001375D2A2|nr:transporter substrate-binding domain-containing protein [Fluviispira multicolorata]
MKKLFFLFLSQLIFINFSAFSQTLTRIKKEGELRVCTSAGYAPFEVKSSSGEWVGFDIKMFELFSKVLNVKLNMLDIRWEGVFPALLAMKCDFITGGMSVTKEREKVINFSDPIYKSGNSLVVSMKAKDKYKVLSDLDKVGVKIAVKTGNTADFFLKKVLKHAKILRFDTNADLITAVLENRTDAFAQDSIFSMMASSEHKGKLYILKDKLNYEDLAVGIRKKDTALLKEFNNFLGEWKKNGGYDKAVHYYLESDDWRAELKHE